MPPRASAKASRRSRRDRGRRSNNFEDGTLQQSTHPDDAEAANLDPGLVDSVGLPSSAGSPRPDASVGARGVSASSRILAGVLPLSGLLV